MANKDIESDIEKRVNPNGHYYPGEVVGTYFDHSDMCTYVYKCDAIVYTNGKYKPSFGWYASTIRNKSNG